MKGKVSIAKGGEIEELSVGKPRMCLRIILKLLLYIRKCIKQNNARMAEWSKAEDLSSPIRKDAWVQTPLRAIFFTLSPKHVSPPTKPIKERNVS